MASVRNHRLFVEDKIRDELGRVEDKGFTVQGCFLADLQPDLFKIARVLHFLNPDFERGMLPIPAVAALIKNVALIIEGIIDFNGFLEEGLSGLSHGEEAFPVLDTSVGIVFRDEFIQPDREISAGNG